MFQKIKKRRPFIGILSMLLIALMLPWIPAVLADSEIVGSDYYSGEKLGMYTVIYKDTGELDPNYDYYSIRVMISDEIYRNNWDIGPLTAHVHLAIPNYSVGTVHEPQAGFHYGVSTISFGYQGISYQIQIPAATVSYDTSDDGFWGYYDWDVTAFLPYAVFGWIFKDYAEFSIGIRVPEGYTAEVYSQGLIGWGQWLWYLGNDIYYYPYDSAEYHWLHVAYDPQNRMSGPINENTQNMPTPYDPPIITPHQIPLNSASIPSQRILLK